jgi:hypothetical protein
VVTIFVIIKDTCGVHVADRVVVCELLLVGEVSPLVLSGLGGQRYASSVLHPSLILQ